MEPDLSERPLLPEHGRLDCSACFPPATAWGGSYACDGWQLERNPCAWGSCDPVVLVLGFSKGRNQSGNIVDAEGPEYDAVPFRHMRRNLTAILQRLRLLGPGDEIDNHIDRDERTFAFGSLIRCSIARLDKRTGRYLKSGDVIHALAEQRDRDYIHRCARRFLSALPPRLRLVVMLSNDLTYVEACKEALAIVHPELTRLNPVAYRTGAVTWVHVVHPSGASGKHVPAWLDATEGVQAQKREWAIAALSAAAADGAESAFSLPK
jgi:hypothetical protein